MYLLGPVFLAQSHIIIISKLYKALMSYGIYTFNAYCDYGYVASYSSFQNQKGTLSFVATVWKYVQYSYTVAY